MKSTLNIGSIWNRKTFPIWSSKLHVLRTPTSLVMGQSHWDLPWASGRVARCSQPGYIVLLKIIWFWHLWWSHLRSQKKSSRNHWIAVHLLYSNSTGAFDLKSANGFTDSNHQRKKGLEIPYTNLSLRRRCKVQLKQPIWKKKHMG